MEKLFKKLLTSLKVFRPRKMIDILFASYTVLIIVPILILGVIFTVLSIYQFSDQAKKTDSYMINEFANTLSADFDTVYNITYNLRIDEEVKNLSKFKDYSYEFVQQLESVTDSLQNHSIRSEIINELIVSYNEAEYAVSSIQGKSDYERLCSKFGMTDEEFIKTISGSDGDVIAVETEGMKYILYIRSIDKSVYAIFDLNREYIEGLIDDINYEERSDFFLLDKNYKCLVEKGNPEFAESLNGEGILLGKAKNSRDYVEARIDGKNVLLFVQNVPMTTLNTCYVLNRSHYYTKFSYIWVIILFICVFIICIGVFAAKLYSRRIYRPFNNIIEIFKPKKAEYGKKSELEFLESKFEEIANMQNELAEYKDRYSSSYLEGFFYNYLNGYITDLTVLRQSLEGFDVILNEKYYTIALIKIDRLSEILKNIQLQHFQKFVKENIVAALDNSYPESYSNVYEFYDREYIGLIFASNYDTELDKGLAVAQRTIAEQLEITISVGIGERADTMEDLPGIYEKLYHHMSETRLCGYGFMFCDKPPVSGDKSHKTFSDYEERVTELFAARNYDGLDAIVDEIFSERRYSFRQTVQMFNSCIVMLLKMAGNVSDYADETMMNISPYNEIEKFNTVDEICDYLKMLYRKVGDGVEEKVQNNGKMNEKIISYIKENYMKQIDLQTIAEHFGYSKGYFSRYFKKITGKNYVEMLNCYRIDVAKELIKREQHMKLFEVAEVVGFTSYKTFSEAFKKYDGRSPENYKNSLT